MWNQTSLAKKRVLVTAGADGIGLEITRAFVEAGVPDDVFVNLFLDHATTSALIATGKFNFINFTGSVEGGRSIERAAAGTFGGIGLELVGKDPG